MFLFFIHDYAGIIDMSHLFFGFCKTISHLLRINQKSDNIPRNNTILDFVNQILIYCYLLEER